MQLTFHFLDDVVADLAARGYGYEPTDIGYRFEPGFAVFSVGSFRPQMFARDFRHHFAQHRTP